MPSRFPFLDHPGPLPFSHAGGAKEAIENTWPAFEATVALGYRYLETDAVATRDGVLLAFHDPVLDRLTDQQGEIAKLDYSQVQSAVVSGQEPIPRLDEVFARWPDLRLNIEPKTDEAVGPLAELIRRTASIDRVCVGSFSDRRIRKLRDELGAALCTSIGPLPIAALRLSSWGVPFLDRVVRRTGAGCAQIPVKQSIIRLVDRRMLERAHGLGLQLHVWTIDDADEMGALLDLGVDGIMSDRPSVLKDVLVARGQWYDGSA